MPGLTLCFFTPDHPIMLCLFTTSHTISFHIVCAFVDIDGSVLRCDCGALSSMDLFYYMYRLPEISIVSYRVDMLYPLTL